MPVWEGVRLPVRGVTERRSASRELQFGDRDEVLDEILERLHNQVVHGELPFLGRMAQLLMQFLRDPNRSRNSIIRMNPRSCHVSNLRGNRARVVDIARGNARLWRFLVFRARS